MCFRDRNFLELELAAVAAAVRSSVSGGGGRPLTSLGDWRLAIGDWRLATCVGGWLQKSKAACDCRSDR